MLRAALLFCCLQLAAFTDPGCVIELECRECLPAGMPLVESHRARGGQLRAAPGDALALSCRGGRFLAYPLRGTLVATCERGRYRVRADNSLRHLLELGCQEEVFEDVLHETEHCAPPYQGRAYTTQLANGTRLAATLCFDADRAQARAALASARPAHAPRRAAAPRSLLGSFSQMFDERTRAHARALYGDEARLNRRVRELLKHDFVTLADQKLTSVPLLSPHYFDDQEMRVADFASNRVAAWRGPAEGNLRHLHSDVSTLISVARNGSAPLDVWTGTHGVMSLRAGSGKVELFLQPGRFPVPKYIWTVVHDPRANRAIAVVLLNDPFVSVSEIRAAVFCESACAGAGWLRALLRNRNYECPALGLVFCCAVHDFAALVPEFPRDAVKNVPAGNLGMLVSYSTVE